MNDNGDGGDNDAIEKETDAIQDAAGSGGDSDDDDIQMFYEAEDRALYSNASLKPVKRLNLLKANNEENNDDHDFDDDDDDDEDEYESGQEYDQYMNQAQPRVWHISRKRHFEKVDSVTFS